MKRVLLTAIIGVSLLLLFLQSNWVQSFFLRSSATLTIQNANFPLALYIDNQLSGTLPLNEQRISAGVHTFILQSTKGEKGVQLYWQGELEVNPEDSVVITLVSSTQNKIDGIVVTRFFTGENSRVFMDQPGKVYVNNQVYDKSPALLNSKIDTDIRIRTEHPVYQDIQFSFTKKPSTAFSAHIYLQYDYVQNILREDVTLPETVEGIGDISRRWDWQSKEVPIPAESYREASWEAIGVYSLVIPQYSSAENALRQIEQRFVDLDLAARIPFCFVVDPDSQVWEGYGVWDYDFSILKDIPLELKEKNCPILVIKKAETDIIPIELLSKISTFMLQPELYTATVQKQFDAVRLKAQESEVIDIAITNTGWGSWHVQDGESIEVVYMKDSSSAVFDQDNWLSPKIVNRVTDPLVIPGGTVSLSLPLKAGMYSIRYTEPFAISREGQMISETIIEIPIEIEGAGVAVEVTDPPNGFLNVYESDSENTRLLTSLFANERHAFLEEKGAWAKIRLRDGRDGWVKRQFIRQI